MTRRRRRATAPGSAAPRRRRTSAVEESLETLGVTLGGAVQSTGIGAQMMHLTTYQNWPSFPWEAGDGTTTSTGSTGRHHDDTSAVSFRTDWDADTLARLQRIADSSNGTTEPDQPVWWIVFQMSWWAPQWITGGLLVGILIPFRLLDIVDEDKKTDALALITVLNTVVNLCGPLFGGASDAMPYTRIGRRRPFILLGMLGVAASIYIMCYAHTYVLFFIGWALFCVGNNCAQPAYSCLLPELVPNQQRGLASGIFVFFQVFGALISSGLGLLVGQGTISDDAAYWVLIGLALYSSLAGCVGMGRHPGIWSPERPPLDENQDEEDADKQKEVPKAHGSEAEPQLIQSDLILAPFPAPLRKLLSFFTAFGSGNFRWLFIYIFIWSSSGQFGNLFKAYWMADVIGPDFDFFGYEIAKCSVVPPEEFESCTSSGAQSALSIMNGMNQLMSMVTAVLGGWLGDRYGKRAVLTAVFLILWQPIVWMAFTTSFTTVAVLNIYSGLFGGMLGGPINGLMADVLPMGSDGKPTHPTRDWNLICQAWSLPGIVFPMILGSAFAWPIFPNKRAVYSSFFLINAFCNIIQIPCLANIDFSDGGQARRGAYVDGRVAQYSAPLGARLCDLFLWRRVVDELESPLAEQKDSESGHGEPEHDDGEAVAVLFQKVLAAKSENV